MWSKNKFDTWLKKNFVVKTERVQAGKKNFIFAEIKDGRIAIFEKCGVMYEPLATLVNKNRAMKFVMD